LPIFSTTLIAGRPNQQPDRRVEGAARSVADAAWQRTAVDPQSVRGVSRKAARPPVKVEAKVKNSVADQTMKNRITPEGFEVNGGRDLEAVVERGHIGSGYFEYRTVCGFRTAAVASSVCVTWMTRVAPSRRMTVVSTYGGEASRTGVRVTNESPSQVVVET
jgi:hypothetical protein